MIISITKLQLKSFWHLYTFMNHVSSSSKQARSSRGIKYIGLKSDLRSLTFYTLTAWENEDCLKEFMLSEHHKKAMKATQQVAKKAISTHFNADQVPNWGEALQTLTENKKKL